MNVNIGRTRIGLSKGPEGIFRHFSIEVNFDNVAEDKVKEMAANMVKTLYRNRWAAENKGKDSRRVEWPAEEEATIVINAEEFATKQARGRKPVSLEAAADKMTTEQLQSLQEMIQRKLAGFSA